MEVAAPGDVEEGEREEEGEARWQEEVGEEEEEEEADQRQRGGTEEGRADDGGGGDDDAAVGGAPGAHDQHGERGQREVDTLFFPTYYTTIHITEYNTIK